MPLKLSSRITPLLRKEVTLSGFLSCRRFLWHRFHDRLRWPSYTKHCSPPSINQSINQYFPSLGTIKEIGSSSTWSDLEGELCFFFLWYWYFETVLAAAFHEPQNGGACQGYSCRKPCHSVLSYWTYASYITSCSGNDASGLGENETRSISCIKDIPKKWLTSRTLEHSCCYQSHKNKAFICTLPAIAGTLKRREP